MDANSEFDTDGITELNSGDVNVNGEKVTDITFQHICGGRCDHR